jgi:Doubled CXXCH motif (Paired_CXXCH_1)
MSPARWWRLAGVLLLIATASGSPPAPPKAKPQPPPSAPPAAPAARPVAGDEIESPPPPFSDGVFPCSDCHEKGAEFDETRRELSQHDFVFEHDAEHRWCLDCHDPVDRDKLRLASGALIDFAESYKLCGQCHGDKARDWRVGVHGRRTGSWNGKKTYLLCVHCHSPHSPRFKPLKPEPPPLRPEQVR